MKGRGAMKWKTPIRLSDLFVFRWNRPGLPGRKGKLCRVLKRGRMNSCSIAFLSDGYRAVLSRNVIRRATICDLHIGKASD